jgi:SagB-type dehydrogenase family enzyme
MVHAPEYHERSKRGPSDFENVELERDFETMPRPFETYRDRPKVSLSDVRAPVLPAVSAIAETGPDPLADADQTARDPIDAATVASLCYYAAGIKAERSHPIDAVDHPMYYRMASCTGNLHHIETYVVCTGLDGLDAGVYRFDPVTFSLDVLRDGDFRGVLAEAAGEETGVADAPVTLALTTEWWRNAWKYSDRTYRHAFWDSGTVLSHLLGTAHAFDLPASVVAGFDDQTVADLLGIDPGTEAPLELVPVGEGAPADYTPEVDSIDSATGPHSDHDRSHDLPHEAWATSALSDGEAASAWRDRVREALPVGKVAAGDGVAQEEKPSEGGDAAGADGERVPLDPVDYETEVARPLSATVRRRRSAREYADEPVSRRKFATILDRALRGVPLAVSPEDALALTDAYVAVSNVEGIEAGVYRYLPRESALERIADADRQEIQHAAMAQSPAGEAAVNVYLVTDVGRVAGELGDRGYRLAQLEASVALGRLYLATDAHRNVGGRGLTFYDDAVTDLLTPRAADQTPMTTFVFGHPAE